MKPITLAMPDDLVVRIDSVAAATDRSRSHIARQLIEAGFAQTFSSMSDSYDQLRREQIAEAARQMAERIQPKPAEPNKDPSQ